MIVTKAERKLDQVFTGLARGGFGRIRSFFDWVSGEPS